MMAHTNLRPILSLTYSLINHSRLLIAESKKLIDRSQKIIDDETAKDLNKKQHGARGRNTRDAAAFISAGIAQSSHRGL
jgi:hypothetical protein